MSLVMKRVLSLIFVTLLLVSCEEDPFNAFLKKGSFSPKESLEFDMTPVVVRIEVTDTQGRNLFEESTPGNWLTSSFSATFDGTEFVWPSAQTKVYLAWLKGFYLDPVLIAQSHKTILFFGELDGLNKWDTDLCITWPDGTKDTIRVQHAFRWTKEGWPDSYTGFKVNGIPVEGDVIYLTK